MIYRRSSILKPELTRAVTAQFLLSPRSVHGPAHWMRVRHNGLLLAELTGANKRVIELFALFHDSCRQNDFEDPEHGPRGAVLAYEYFYKRKLLDCTKLELELLAEACCGHTYDHTHDDITVSTCWDADRLDLPRCWITVDPSRLATEEARDARLIREAENRARSWLDRMSALQY